MRSALPGDVSMSNLAVNFIKSEELSKLLAVFAFSILNRNSSEFESQLDKACKFLVTICEPYANAFTASTGNQVIPWSCEDISNNYPEALDKLIVDDINASMETLMAMPNLWISCDGRDFSKKSHYQALAFLIFGIGHLSIKQIPIQPTHHVA